MRLGRADLGSALSVGAALVLLGAPLGLVWSWAVPDLSVVHVGTGRGYLLPTAAEDAAVPAGDLVMVLILVLVGLAAGAVVTWRARRAPLGVVVGLLLGGTLAGTIALAVGHVLVRGDYTAVYAHPADYVTPFQVRPYVRGTVDLVVLPLAALLVYGTALLVRGNAGERLSSETAARG